MNKKQQIGEKELDEFKPFIRKESSKFSKSSNVCDFNDLQQAGFLGLLSAYKNFDPSKGKWKTYAMSCIRNAIQSESIQFLKNVTIPKAVAIHYYKIKKLINSGKSVSEVCETLSLSESYTSTLIHLSDITAKETRTEFDNVESNSLNDPEYVSGVREAFEKLNMEEKEILELKTQYTFSEIGDRLNISREWARKKYKSVLEKLVNSI